MCKNLFIIGATNPANTEKFCKVMAPIMSKTDNDGIGYAALTTDGKLFSEKWLKNAMAFPSKHEDKILKLFGSLANYATITTDNYATTGTIEWDKVSTVLLHTRKSTNKVCIENTHPFIIDNTALVHNGIINNHGTFKKNISTCDSEAILTLYNEHEITANEFRFNEVSAKLDGWYACGVINKDKDTWFVDVFRHNAMLYGCWVEDIGGLVISTSDDYLKEGLIKTGFKSTKIYQLNEHIFTRYNPFDSEIISQFAFSEKKIERNYGNGGYGNKSHLYDSYDRWENYMVFGNFFQWEIDSLEELYDTLPKDECIRLDKMTNEDKYVELRRMKIVDNRHLPKAL
jgi:hypothetical protein